MSKLSYLRDAVCADTCNRIVDLAEPFLAELVAYDVTALTLAGVRERIRNFRAFINAPRKKIIDRSMSTKKIGEMISFYKEILAKLDVKMGPLVTREPAFYAKYMKSRELVHSGGRKLSLMFRVVDVHGVGVEKVSVRFEGSKLVKKTTAKGNFQVRYLVPGMYRVRCTKYGMEDFVQEFAINGGLRTRVEVVMERAVAV